MLKMLQKMFTDTIEHRSQDATELDRDAFQVATCALLLEVAHADQELDDAEMRTLVNILKTEFSLSEDLVEDLISLVEEKRDESVSFWRYARTIRDHCSVQEREQMLEYLWRIVFADKELAGHEDAFMRQCAGALNLHHESLIRAKLRAIPGRKE